MECKLELSVFRFDAKTDFLPYYKKHFITIDRSLSVNDLLAQIKAEDVSFDYPKGDLAALKINTKALFTNVSIDGLVHSFGKSLTLEPLSTKRVIKDMIINTDDFYQRFDLLDAFVDGKDRPLYEHYIIYHYASSVLDLLENYQGDALFAFAYDMIQKHPERKKEILEVIANDQTGIFLHVRLCKKIYPCGADVEKKITELKNDVMKHRPFANPLVEKFSHHIDLL
jgi:succinate dehydrogenase/fumarate reductase-like Fe-S protein